MLNIDGIGRLTKRIEVLAYQDIESNGITKQKLVRLIPNRIWARIEPLRGRQYLEMYVNVNIRMYNFDDVQCTVIPSVAYGFVTGMNLQLC